MLFFLSIDCIGHSFNLFLANSDHQDSRRDNTNFATQEAHGSKLAWHYPFESDYKNIICRKPPQLHYVQYIGADWKGAFTVEIWFRHFLISFCSDHISPFHPRAKSGLMQGFHIRRPSTRNAPKTFQRPKSTTFTYWGLSYSLQKTRPTMPLLSFWRLALHSRDST